MCLKVTRRRSKYTEKVHRQVLIYTKVMFLKNIVQIEHKMPI